MKEKNGTLQLISEFLFAIELKIPDQINRMINITEQFCIGLDPRNDLILIDPKITTKHFIFCKKHQTLAVHYLGEDGNTFLNDQLLESGKIYLCELGDVFKIGKIELIIHERMGGKERARNNLGKG